MASAEQWLKTAQQNRDAAKSIQQSFARSAVSRAYYSVYAASHAILLHLKERPREDWGTWAHEDLPGTLRSTLSRGTVPFAAGVPVQCKEIVTRCYKKRLTADYAPGLDVDPEMAKEACRDADRMVATAKRIME